MESEALRDPVRPLKTCRSQLSEVTLISKGTHTLTVANTGPDSFLTAGYGACQCLGNRPDLPWPRPSLARRPVAQGVAEALTQRDGVGKDHLSAHPAWGQPGKEVPCRKACSPASGLCHLLHGSNSSAPNILASRLPAATEPSQSCERSINKAEALCPQAPPVEGCPLWGAIPPCYPAPGSGRCSLTGWNSLGRAR